MLLLDAIFFRPIFSIKQLSEKAQIPKPSLHSLLKILQKEGIIITLRQGLGRRPSILVFPELLNIAEGREVVKISRSPQ